MSVRVNLKGTFGYGGKRYGPGNNVEVPEALARALGLQPLDAPKAAPKAAKPAKAKDAA